MKRVFRDFDNIIPSPKQTTPNYNNYSNNLIVDKHHEIVTKILSLLDNIYYNNNNSVVELIVMEDLYNTDDPFLKEIGWLFLDNSWRYPSILIKKNGNNYDLGLEVEDIIIYNTTVNISSLLNLLNYVTRETQFGTKNY